MGECILVGELAQANHRTLKLSQMSFVLRRSVMGECIIDDEHKRGIIIRDWNICQLSSHLFMKSATG